MVSSARTTAAAAAEVTTMTALGVSPPPLRAYGSGLLGDDNTLAVAAQGAAGLLLSTWVGGEGDRKGRRGGRCLPLRQSPTSPLALATVRVSATRRLAHHGHRRVRQPPLPPPSPPVSHPPPLPFLFPSTFPIPCVTARPCPLSVPMPPHTSLPLHTVP